jgi:hypothetical protein
VLYILLSKQKNNPTNEGYCLLEYFSLHPSKCYLSLVPGTHTCNPSYSGGKEQEDQGSKPAQANSSQDPIEDTQYKKGLIERLPIKEEALSSALSTAKKKRKNTQHIKGLVSGSSDRMPAYQE